MKQLSEWNHETDPELADQLNKQTFLGAEKIEKKTMQYNDQLNLRNKKGGKE